MNCWISGKDFRREIHIEKEKMEQLPDIITCCRFSLHDASHLKDSLMDLSTTNAAGAVYDTYLNSFRNQDGSVNWLPVCADAHGFEMCIRDRHWSAS